RLAHRPGGVRAGPAAVARTAGRARADGARVTGRDGRAIGPPGTPRSSVEPRSPHRTPPAAHRPAAPAIACAVSPAAGRVARRARAGAAEPGRVPRSAFPVVPAQPAASPAASPRAALGSRAARSVRRSRPPEAQAARTYHGTP